MKMTLPSKTMNPFEQLNPEDGYQVVVTTNSCAITLYAVPVGGGIPSPANPESAPEDPSVELATWESPTEQDKGAAIRLTLVCQAVARFLTTGGRWQELAEMLRTMSKVFPDGLAYPGWFLRDSYLTEDNDYQHVFLEENTNRAVLWEEPQHTEKGGFFGGFIDVTTFNKLLEQDYEPIWGRAKTEPRKTSPTDPLSLPARRCNEDTSTPT